MWFNKEEQSRWACEHCLRLFEEGKEDIDEIWKLIETSEWCYLYCKCIEDKKELWSKITVPVWANHYCLFVKNRPEVAKHVCLRIRGYK